MRKFTPLGLSAAIAVMAATVGVASARAEQTPAPAYGGKQAPASVAELEARHKAYLSAVDANSDGVITPEERQAHRAAKMAERRKAMFPDKNGDGSVDRFEWEEAARTRFDRLDVNGDGFISEAEAAQAAKARRGRDPR